MEPNFDCRIFSNLLCAEDDSIFDDDDDPSHLSNHRNDDYAHNQSFHVGGAPPLESEEDLSILISKESEHLPKDDYSMRLRNGELDSVARTEAIDWIRKINAHFGFGPTCACLSVNYFDRFMSFYDIPKEKEWMMQLLAVGCLSLAAKLEESEVPLSLDLQVGVSKFVFEAKTIQRMENLVLSTLKWRLLAVTPLSFLDSFQSRFNFDRSVQKVVNLKSVELILSTLKGIEFLEFKPSEITAAVLISSSEEFLNALDIENSLSSLSAYVSMERVLKCKELIKENGPIDLLSFQSFPQSPNGVLEGACLSFKSDDSQNNSPLVKRRRVDGSGEIKAMD